MDGRRSDCVIEHLEKTYKSAIDRLRTSGIGVESDDDLEDHNIYVNFKWFWELHFVMRRRAVESIARYLPIFQPAVTRGKFI